MGSRHHKQQAISFALELKKLIPKSKFFRRFVWLSVACSGLISPQNFPMKKIIAEAIEHKFTDVIVVNEDKNLGANALLVSHLPNGPTATFRLSNIKFPKGIDVRCAAAVACHKPSWQKHGTPTSHLPEIIINNFHTRLGHQVGRMMTALFPQQPQFVGRNVVTFHNQRDFIFFRRHRCDGHDRRRSADLVAATSSRTPSVLRCRSWVRGSRSDACLAASHCQRAQLKLRRLQVGAFDGKFGQYEWVYKVRCMPLSHPASRLQPEMSTSAKRFFL